MLGPDLACSASVLPGPTSDPPEGRPAIQTQPLVSMTLSVQGPGTRSPRSQETPTLTQFSCPTKEARSGGFPDMVCMSGVRPR